MKTVENGVVTNYTSNNVNAYTAISGGMSFTPSYDGNGNMLNDDKHQYVYDYNSKMVSVGDKSVTYKYDALGRRIAKNSTLFYYAGDQMVEESTDGTVTSYLYGNNIDEALQMSRKDEAYYYHTNHLGSTMGLSNKEGKIVEKVEYDVYGMPTFLDAEGNVLENSSVGNNNLFTGREYDVETDDYFFRARNIHPMMGRFMQKDPLMYVDGMNDYLYIRNKIISNTDPYGFYGVGGVGGAGSSGWNNGFNGSYHSDPLLRSSGRNFMQYGKNIRGCPIDIFEKSGTNATAKNLIASAGKGAGNSAFGRMLGGTIKGAGAGLGALFSGVFGYNDAQKGNNGLAGFTGAVVGGAATGAIFGSMAGGVGAAPGALIGGISSGIGYLIGYGIGTF